MKVLILAAGTSSRLRPLTEQVPKTLLELEDNFKMIDCILHNCYQHDLKDFHIVTGHGHDQIQTHLENFSQSKKDVSYDITFNPEYDTKGNIYSFYLGHQALDQDYILIHSDTIFHPEIIKYILDHPEQNVMAVDDAKELSDEEMKIYQHDGSRVKKVNKALDPQKAVGEHIGVFKISKNIKQDLTKAIEEVLEKDDSAYYEDSIQVLIDRNIPFHWASTRGLPCMEIDTHEDLQQAKQLIKKCR